MLNDKPVFRVSMRQRQNSLVNRGSRSLMICLGSPWCATISLKKAAATSTLVVDFRGTKQHIFEKRSTTVMIVVQSSSAGKSVMKSMCMVCHGISGHYKG